MPVLASNFSAGSYDEPNRSSQRALSVVEYAATYVVEDTRGDRFQMYEFRGTRFFRRVRIFELETGAPVKRVDFDTYEVGTTGERLVRVAR
jgi:hypothetical protein